MAEIDISGIFPLDLLAALYNHAATKQSDENQRPASMSQALAADVWNATVQQDCRMLHSVYGVSLHVDLSGPIFDTYLYDDANEEEGAGEHIVAQLRAGLNPFAAESAVDESEEMLVGEGLRNVDLIRYKPSIKSARQDIMDENDALEAEAEALDTQEKLQALQKAMGPVKYMVKIQIGLAFES